MSKAAQSTMNIEAGRPLIFVDDAMPGITREKMADGWRYRDAAGRLIRRKSEIDRLNGIALPPAYTDAWFCPADNGHILATGYDARGRKQYRYNPEFRLARESRKFDGLAGFARLLPLVRRRVADDLAGTGIGRERAIASIVRLLDSGSIRIGNDQYAKANRSFGATTLRMQHVTVSGPTLQLRFRAKSGQWQDIALTDKALARFVRTMQDLPGQRLFQYRNSAGDLAALGSHDVNDYLRETMGADCTAKHFRTWAASAHAFALIIDADPAISPVNLATEVAARLGNTPAVARKSYIHPALMELAHSEEAQAAFRASCRLPRSSRWLARHERGLIAWLDDAAPRAAEFLAA